MSLPNHEKNEADPQFQLSKVAKKPARTHDPKTRENR